MKLKKDMGNKFDIKERKITGLVQIEDTDTIVTLDYFNASYFYKFMQYTLHNNNLEETRIELAMVKSKKSDLHIPCIRFIDKNTNDVYPADGYFALAPCERSAAYPQIEITPSTDPAIAELRKQINVVEKAVNGIVGTLKLNKQHYEQAETVAICMEKMLRGMYTELANIEKETVTKE